MKKNAIILTSGLSGSSVLTALIARAGYWTGDKTYRKKQYETFENQGLIDLNLKLFQEVDYKGEPQIEASRIAMQQIASISDTIDCTIYRSFIERCTQNQPWVWKDPRLWLTIRFWKNLVDLGNCRFILLSRDLTQSWISSTLNRQIFTYRFCRSYENNIRQLTIDFLRENEFPYLHLTYEGLILHPGKAVDQLNLFLGTALGVADLKSVYHKPLYKNPRNSWAKHLMAVLIYFKNYSSRLDIGG
jgi:hypothetical protein